MKLRTYRLMANLTQQELANRVGVSELSIIKYESGQTIPSKEIIRKIYAITGGSVTPNDFFDLDPISTQVEPDSPDGTFVAAGLMSGTSMDGIDAALMITDGEGFIKDLGSHSLQYDTQFKLLLKGCERATWEAEGDLNRAGSIYEEATKRYLCLNQSITESEADSVFHDLCAHFHGASGAKVTFNQVIQRSSDLHARVVRELLQETDYKARSLDIVGYHGQTLFHRPSKRITIQAGDAQSLANQIGITVAYDFRSNDVRNGGQGAPFAPLYHKALARQIGLTPVVIANCGGISNITIIGSADDELCAFDCGPGNTLIDRFVQLKIGREMDEDGIFGSQGGVNREVMAALRAKAIVKESGENYLDRQPPKSLDVNDLVLIPEVMALSLQDGCATLEAFTAECMVESLAYIISGIPKFWVLAGGGWKNKVIKRELEEHLRRRLGNDVKVRHADEVGWSGQAMEAQIFAYLAVRSLRGLPLSMPGTTGAPKPLTGGEIAVPQGDCKKASRNVRLLLEV